MLHIVDGTSGFGADPLEASRAVDPGHVVPWIRRHGDLVVEVAASLVESVEWGNHAHLNP